MKPLEYDIGEVIKLFEANKVFDLRGLSSRVIREAALNNDYAKADLGVIAYALHKIESKQHFVNSPQWGRLKQSVLTDLKNAQIAIKQNNTSFFRITKKVIQHITKIDSQLGNYAIGIMKRKSKTSSLAYLMDWYAQAAQLTGATKKLQEYIGATTMHDEELEIKNMGQRVNELKILQVE